MRLSRIPRVAASFAIVWIAYYAYALAVAPLIEPRIKAAGGSSTAADREAARGRVDRHDGLLAELFPPDAWERRGPKILESDQAMLLIEDYRPLADGRMELRPCTLVFFPEAAEAGRGKSRRGAVILQAPEGALLQFDQPLDLTRAKIGRLVGGRLVGPVRITRDETAPGADDRLEIVTQNLQMNHERLWTPHPIRFRFGPHHGSGQDLIVTFLPPATGASRSHGPAVGGVESIELVHLDKLHLAAGRQSLLPFRESPPPGGTRARPAAPQGHPAADEAVPVEVTCQGPLALDLIGMVLSLEDRVNVVKLNPAGPSDQLNCELLEIHFRRPAVEGDRTAPTAAAGTPDAAPPAAAEEGRAAHRLGADTLPSMAVAQIVARGHPVVVRVPSSDAEARGERLVYDVLEQRIRLEGRQPVQLRHGRQQVQAPSLEYEMPKGGVLGRLWSTGPGWFRGAASPSQPAGLFARWGGELRLRPHEGRHVLSVTEGGALDAEALGGIAAREMHVWLREVPAAGEGQPAVFVERMAASGDVQLRSPQLVGLASELKVWVTQAPPAAAAGDSSQAAPPWGEAPPPGGAPQPQFEVAGERMHLQLVQRGGALSVAAVAVEGQARFAEYHAGPGGEAPLAVTGDAIRATQADTPHARLSVVGRPAQAAARGMAIAAAEIQLDRGENRVWIDGPGRVGLTLDRDLNGQRIARPTPLEIVWQGGMDFRGRVIEFRDQVEVRSEAQFARADTLAVALVQPLDLGRLEQPAALDVRDLALRGDVWIDSRTMDEGRLTSIEQMQLRSLHVDRVSGELRGEGPGWISSVRRDESGGAGQALWSVPGRNPPPPVPRSDEASPRLTSLYVQFVRELTGNVHQREMHLHQNVKAAFGPAADWQSPVRANPSEGPGPDVVLMTCDRLSVVELAAGGGRSSVELAAVGNTTVEGAAFTAQAGRISYAQAKDLLVLEGDGRAPAQLWRQAQVGGPRQHAAAGKILFWRRANTVEVDDARLLDLGHLGG